MLSRERIAAEFKETYECVTDIDTKFMQLTGNCCIDFALYIAEMARKEALEEVTDILKKSGLDATLRIVLLSIEAEK